MIALTLLSLLTADPLPGIADTETSIAYATPGGVQEVHRGHGDVVFVRDRRNKWYRLALNEGCLDKFSGAINVFGVDAGIDRRLDANDRVIFNTNRSCLVDSIRRSEAPPQVDSKSIVTLD